MKFKLAYTKDKTKIQSAINNNFIDSGDLVIVDNDENIDNLNNTGEMIFINEKGKQVLLNSSNSSASQIQVDFNQNDKAQVDYIKNKPPIYQGELNNSLQQKNSNTIFGTFHESNDATISSGRAENENYILQIISSDTEIESSIAIRLEAKDEINKSVYVDIIKVKEVEAVNDSKTLWDFTLEKQPYFINIQDVNINIETVKLSFILKNENQNDVDYNIALGDGTYATQKSAIALGYKTLSAGAYSYAEGNGTIASGNASHAEGNKSIAEGAASHAEGAGTTASGQNSHTEGQGTVANGPWSHAEGFQTNIYIDNKQNTEYIKAGNASHAEGKNTGAKGNYSHAEGMQTIARGKAAHAEGEVTQANGISSHAEGLGTIAEGSQAHAEGYATKAMGDYSHSSGLGTIAKGQAQTAIGKYNEEDSNQAFIIGGGNTTNRTNVFAVDFNGNVATKGGVKINNDIIASNVSINNNIITKNNLISSKVVTDNVMVSNNIEAKGKVLAFNIDENKIILVDRSNPNKKYEIFINNGELLIDTVPPDAPKGISIVNEQLINIDTSKVYEVAKITLPKTELETQAMIGEYSDYVAGETKLTAGLWLIRIKEDDENKASNAAMLWSRGNNVGSVAFALENDLWDTNNKTEGNSFVDNGLGKWYFVNTSTENMGAKESYAIQTTVNTTNNYFSLTFDVYEKEEFLTGMLTYIMTEDEYIPIQGFRGWDSSMFTFIFPGADVASNPATLEGKIIIHVYDNGTITQYETTTGAWSVSQNTTIRCDFTNIIPHNATGYIFRIDIDFVDENKYTLEDITIIDNEYSPVRLNWSSNVTSDKTRINYSHTKKLAPTTNLAYSATEAGDYIITGFNSSLSYKMSTDGITFVDIDAGIEHLNVTNTGVYYFYSIENDIYFISDMATIEIK